MLLDLARIGEALGGDDLIFDRGGDLGGDRVRGGDLCGAVSSFSRIRLLEPMGLRCIFSELFNALLDRVSVFGVGCLGSSTV